MTPKKITNTSVYDTMLLENGINLTNKISLIIEKTFYCSGQETYVQLSLKIIHLYPI